MILIRGERFAKLRRSSIVKMSASDVHVRAKADSPYNSGMLPSDPSRTRGETACIAPERMAVDLVCSSCALTGELKFSVLCGRSSWYCQTAALREDDVECRCGSSRGAIKLDRCDSCALPHGRSRARMALDFASRRCDGADRDAGRPLYVGVDLSPVGHIDDRMLWFWVPASRNPRLHAGRPRRPKQHPENWTELKRRGEGCRAKGCHLVRSQDGTDHRHR